MTYYRTLGSIPHKRHTQFRKPDGSVRVHREVVSGLQLLRNRFGRGISVRETSADGLGAVISGAPVEQLLKAADDLESHKLFSEAVREGDAVRVRIHDPENLPDVGLEQVLETAFSVTAAFETVGDKFQQVTGNFDGAGLSFGPAQVNFGTGTLPPLFEEFRRADEAALKACFDDPDDYAEWLDVLGRPKKEQISWADERSTGRGKHAVQEPWSGYLQAVGRVQQFRAIVVESILRKYGARLLKAVKQLQDLKPGIQIDHLRCVCALYDLVIQQGSLSKALAGIEERVKREQPADQFELVRIAVEERGRKALRRWRADCVSRRVGILDGVPRTIKESNETSQRANINFYMLRDVRVSGAHELMNKDVSAELNRVSEALASGASTLLM